jgi:hypothetical protein
LYNPLRIPFRVVWGLTLVALGTALVLILGGGQIALYGGIIGGSIGIVLALISAGLFYTARQADDRLAAFQGGDYLVHWTYSRLEWEKFAEAERERGQKNARSALPVGAFTVAVLGLILGIALAAPLHNAWSTVGVGILGTLAGTAVGAPGGWLVGRLIRLAAERRYHQMHQLAGEAFIGPDSAYCAGRYWKWKGYGTSLQNVELVSGGPAMLTFTIRIYNPRSGDDSHQYRVPVPAGREAEARRLIQVLGRLNQRRGSIGGNLLRALGRFIGQWR